MARIVRDLAHILIGLIEVLLGFRLILKLFGANPAADFVQWVYVTTQPLLNPFTPAFPAPTVQNQFTLEFTTLFAIFVYAFAGYLIEELLNFLAHKRKKR